MFTAKTMFGLHLNDHNFIKKKTKKYQKNLQRLTFLTIHQSHPLEGVALVYHLKYVGTQSHPSRRGDFGLLLGQAWKCYTHYF